MHSMNVEKVDIHPDILFIPGELEEVVLELLMSKALKYIGKYTLWQYKDQKPVWEYTHFEYAPFPKLTVKDFIRGYVEHKHRFSLPRAMRKAGYLTDGMDVYCKGEHVCQKQENQQ